MSEYELLTLLNETQDSFTGLLQWWASISLALMVVAHFAGDKLRWPFLISILILYTAFTILIYLFLLQRGTDISNVMRELRSLDTLTLVGSAKANAKGVNQPVFVVTWFLSYWGTYLAAVAYLVWHSATSRRRLR